MKWEQPSPGEWWLQADDAEGREFGGKATIWKLRPEQGLYPSNFKYEYFINNVWTPTETLEEAKAMCIALVRLEES